MNEHITERNALLQTLNLGVAYQLLLLLVEQAFALQKADTIRALMEVFPKFEASLSEEQKKQFKNRLDTILQDKTQVLGEELEKALTAEELTQLQRALQGSKTGVR